MGQVLHDIQRETQQSAREGEFDVTKGEPWVVTTDSGAKTRLGWDGSKVMASASRTPICGGGTCILPSTQTSHPRQRDNSV